MRFVTIALALLATSSAASAQPGVSPVITLSPAPPPPSATSYRTSIAISDGIAGALTASFTVFGLWCFSETFELFTNDKPDSHPSCPIAAASGIGALGTYALGPAAIHLGHGHLDRAAASVGLRVGLPVATIALLDKADIDSDAAGFLFLGSVLAAVLIDQTVLAKPEPVRRPLALAPVLVPTSDGGGIAGIGGRF